MRRSQINSGPRCLCCDSATTVQIWLVEIVIFRFHFSCRGHILLKNFPSKSKFHDKIILDVIPNLGIWSLQYFAHVTTAELSWHVQNIVTIRFKEFRWKQNEIYIQFDLRWKNRWWNDRMLGHSYLVACTYIFAQALASPHFPIGTCLVDLIIISHTTPLRNGQISLFLVTPRRPL